MPGRPIAAFVVPVIALALASCSATSEPPVDEVLNTSRAAVIVGCLADRGWDLSVRFDGGVSISDVPEEQQGPLLADVRECEEEFPYQAPTASQIREIYAAELDNRECLIDLGYEIGPPPSEQAFVDTFGTAERWYAMTDAHPESMDAGTYEKVFSACVPPAWTL